MHLIDIVRPRLASVLLFLKCRRGNFAVVGTLAAVPLIMALGGAVDLTMMENQRKRLQSASDAAAIAAVRSSSGTSLQERQAEANAMLKVNFGETASGTLSESRGVYTFKISHTSKHAFLPAFGVSNQTISIESSAEAAGTSMDIVLVLDNSLSMSGGKRMVELKKAVTTFLNLIETYHESVQLAVVPFDNMVLVSPGTVSKENSISLKSSVQRNGNPGPAPSSKSELAEEAKVEQGVWSGCITDRFPPYDTDGTPAVRADKETLYPRKACDADELEAILPLSDDIAAVRRTVEAMQPNGWTNNTIGLQWGLEAFSPQAPLTGAAPGARRVMILMTDGENTHSRWEGLGSSRINEKMLATCKSIKDNDIELYTVNLVNGDPVILKNCATSAHHFYNVKTASQLVEVFQGISTRLGGVRLTR